jgi:flagellar biosynthesis/type III secretory pathway ATPase
MRSRLDHHIVWYLVMECQSRYPAVRLFVSVTRETPCEVGPCHHGMARPQVADGGTSSDMEGSCE